MDSQANNSQSISDDQELAKVLAGVSQAADDNLKFEETNSQLPQPAAVSTPPTVDPVATSPADSQTGTSPTLQATAQDPVAPVQPSVVDPTLDSVKQTALSELRPLVDKLNVSPEEKFDTYLLLLRSTDDKDLIAPAHEAAKSITDETKKAQALLDIIKEIDYLSAPKQ